MRTAARRGLMVVVVVTALGCDAPAKAPPPPPAPPFTVVADVKQLMVSVVEPAAEVYWDAVGSVEDSSGVTALYPKTPEAWDAVRNSAYVVAESGNLLMMPPRAVDQREWMTLSLAMIDASKRAIKAAEARDTSAVFNAGAELYETCTACHARYAIATLRPNAR